MNNLNNLIFNTIDPTSSSSSCSSSSSSDEYYFFPYFKFPAYKDHHYDVQLYPKSKIIKPEIDKQQEDVIYIDLKKSFDEYNNTIKLMSDRMMYIVQSYRSCEDLMYRYIGYRPQISEWKEFRPIILNNYKFLPTKQTLDLVVILKNAITQYYNEYKKI